MGKLGLTATDIGREIGASGEVVNKLLVDKGFLEGAPGAWSPTELGARFASPVDRDNGYGGWAHRAWGWNEWDPQIITELGVSREEIAETAAGLKLARATKRAADAAAAEEYWAEFNAKQAGKLMPEEGSTGGMTDGQKLAISAAITAVVVISVVGGVVVYKLVRRRAERKAARDAAK